MAGFGFLRLVTLTGVLGAGLYAAASVYGQGEGLRRAASDETPAVARADTARAAHELPPAVRRLADSPVDGPLRPTIIGMAQPIPEPVAEVVLPVAIEASGSYRSVQVAGANVRGGPSTNHGVIGRVTMGEEVEVVENAGNGWVRVRIQGDGVDGWMAERLLSR